ncbi:hypothetical protein AND_000543 [Anopheles darlingi]|nr:hypothetical protein AND_000543 [Anopheles darlingi]
MNITGTGINGTERVQDRARPRPMLMSPKIDEYARRAFQTGGRITRLTHATARTAASGNGDSRLTDETTLIIAGRKRRGCVVCGNRALPGYAMGTAVTVNMAELKQHLFVNDSTVAVRHGRTAYALTPTVQTTGQTKMMLKESLLIPSMDPEKEAKAMYEKALQQYGIYGKTLKEICKSWVTLGCQCTGTKEEVALACRGIGLEAIPDDLPSELVKL